MNSELTAFITLVCTSGVFNLYLCLYVLFRRHHYTRIANFFVVYTLSITIYCFTAAFGLMAVSLDELKAWTTIQYIGLASSSPLGLLFVMQYLGKKLTPKIIMAFLVIPFISLVMVATNDLHHLHYRAFEVDPLLGAPYIHLEIGIWYIVHGTYTFACMFVAFILVLSSWKETTKIYHKQLIALLLGQLVPMVTAFLYLIGFTPPGIDPVPMVLWISSLLYLWAVSSSRMFTVMPIAKDTIFNSINDGVMVLDESDRLIEYNQACKSMFPRLNKAMYGVGFDKLWHELSGDSFPEKLNRAGNIQEIQLTGNTQSIYQVRSTPLQQANSCKGSLIIFTDITELKMLQRKLEKQAYYDELTQIYNRRAFFEKSERFFTLTQKNSIPFTVILMDIDYFKTVNDSYGHQVGDELLVHVVKMCQKQLMDDMVFARYGGEEFVLALEGYTEAEGEMLANQLRMYIENQPIHVAGQAISVTLSLGLAEASKKNPGETLFQLLKNADQALYAAKEQGRNQVRTYTSIKEKSKTNS